MGYAYNINKKIGYRPKRNCIVPWPCIYDKTRKLELYTDDILTKAPNGTYTKHTGLCCTNIKLKPNQVVKLKEDAELQLI